MDKKNLFKGSTTSIMFTQEIKDKEKQTDENLHKIIFKKYEVQNKIGKTSSFKIYEGINITDKTPVIIKIESRSKEDLYLEIEALNLYTFKDLGIPKIITTGKTKSSIILIEEKLGPSLYDLFIENKRKFSLKEICLIGIQCIERLKGIHSKNYVHRNIKPENFRIGLNDPHVIYLQNFYLCEKYKSSTTNKHVKLSLSNKIVGTERYGSVDALRGLRQGRKDDLESLCYMLIYFFLGKLPWQDIKAENEMEKYKILLNMKKKFNIENYKDIIPKEFRTIFKLIKNLKFDEQPKYSLYIRLLQKIREENQFFDQNDFFWIKNYKNLKIKKNNIKPKKEGFRKRLFLKLNTMEKTEVRPILENNNSNFDQIGERYMDDELSDNGSLDIKTDIHQKISLLSQSENKNEKEKEKEKEEIKEENENNLNDSKSSDSSINTKVYKLNGHIKNFLQKQINHDTDIIINNDSGKDNDIEKDKEKDENIKINSINKKDNLSYIIEEKIEEENQSIINTQEIDKEENKITIQENKINSLNNNDNITPTPNNSNPNSKIGSYTLTNASSEIKETKGKDNIETPQMIIEKKNSNDNNGNNKINMEKRISVDNKKKENRFGQIMGPEVEIKRKNSKSGNDTKDKDCMIF